MRNEKWSQEYLERHVGKEKQEQFYVYVLESVVIFNNGITLPLMSEFLNNEDEEYNDVSADKQDCERKAFYRFSKKVKARFPKLKIAVTMLHAVTCEETWEKTSRTTGKIELKSARYVWISGKELTKSNVENQCIKIGRYRWKIENNFLVVKHQGYQYEH
ncbi:hypothetical protein G9F72_026550 [Clostridium estertheticum]|uniref:hypothetical protein n=1 Tax=Clostridium estertheticum TaxID=238834 RepID=UPI0013E94329|nr:hypothetical protein [Clostridium estertheticum]MBZ9689835.1 hypothetical protein [Clostridium estertheticum]